MQVLYLIGLLVWANVTQADLIKPAPSSDELLHSVIEKLKTDTTSFEDYVMLGKIYCYEKDIYKTSNIYFDVHNTLFNTLKPLPRLLHQDALKKSYQKYLQQVPELSKAASLYDLMTRCDTGFQKDKMQAQYLSFVGNAQNYLTYMNNDGAYLAEDIDGFRQDYLTHYLIQIETQ